MSNSFHHHLKVDFSSQAVSRPQQINSSNYNHHQFTFGSNNQNCVVMKKTTVMDASIPRYTSN